MRVDSLIEARQMTADAVKLGQLEGLMGHAAAAEARLPSQPELDSAAVVSVPAGISTRGKYEPNKLLLAVPKKGRMSEK